MQPVVVYDTNILFSSILWSSKHNRRIELARQNIVKGLTCQEIVELPLPSS
jgi:predicted nucleic acid-binding protein